MRTNAILAELPLTQVQFGSRLNAIGPFTAQLPLGDPGLAKQDPRGSTQPGRTAIYVDRDGVLVWGGILWARKFDSTTRTLDLIGADFPSYYQHRFFNGAQTWTAADQLAIVESTLNTTHGVAGGDIGATVPGNTSGHLRDLTLNTWDLKEIYSQIIELSALDGGFDFAVDVAYDSGVPSKTWTLSYPRRGLNWQNTGWVFESPGNIAHYIWTDDATLQANQVHETGAGNAAAMLVSQQADLSQLAAGYPLLEKVYSHATVSIQATLDAWAVSDSRVFASPVAIPEITVRADLDPVFGSYTIGDDARIRITDDWFPANTADGSPGIDTYSRIVGIDVTPASAAADESVKLTLGASVVQGTVVQPETLAWNIRSQEQRLAALERTAH